MKRVLALVALLFVASASQVSIAQTPSGAAHTVGEAPGGAPLAPMPAEVPSPSDGTDASRARSMSFVSAGGPQCRESVPGGTFLAIAYAVLIVLFGFYVAMLARRNALLTKSIADLATRIEREQTKSAQS